MHIEELAEAIVKRVAELPDRSSPEDWPEAMLVTRDELKFLIVAEFVHAVEAGMPEDPPQTTSASQSVY